MESVPSRLDGPLLLQPAVHGDTRGFLVESYRESEMAAAGVPAEWVQDNHSRSQYGVIRGMHFQVDPPAAKLVRCARGAIADVLVDVRPDSPTYGEWERFELTDENLRVLYIPAGFAHGFAVLSDVADVLYKQSAEWSSDADRGFSPFDPDVGVDWPVAGDARVLSERDRTAPPLSAVVSRA